jgi:hypothetical protein
MAGKQLGSSDHEITHAKTQIKREKFLDVLERWCSGWR